MRALQAEIPVMGARGNHEGTGAVYQKYYPYPYAADCYWSFDYGPVHIVVLDEYTNYTAGSAQYNWLVNDLSSSTKPWKIILAHEPGWAAGTHANNVDIQNIIHPLVKQYGVDLFINGHNHNYARALVEDKNYITTGGGGATLSAPDPTYPNVVSTDMSYHFTEIDIQDNILTVTARRADDTVIETVTVSHGAENQAPVADAGPDQNVTDSDGSGSESVTLNGSASSDPDGTISSYVWNEGAAQIGTGVTPAVTLATGTHTIYLTVTDNNGATATDTVVVTVNAGGGTPTTVISRINGRTDDVEERQSGGAIYIFSSDLELVYDTAITGNQYVGMRFININVPQDKTIINAYIQFTVDEASLAPTNLTIKGQAADNPGTFTASAYDVSSRAGTAGSVSWSPFPWPTVGAAGTNQRTPDVKAIVQEIVNRTGWAQNNSMVFIITGTGKRTAKTYDGSPSQAPQLVITYE